MKRVWFKIYWENIRRMFHIIASSNNIRERGAMFPVDWRIYRFSYTDMMEFVVMYRVLVRQDILGYFYRWLPSRIERHISYHVDWKWNCKCRLFVQILSRESFGHRIVRLVSCVIGMATNGARRAALGRSRPASAGIYLRGPYSSDTHTLVIKSLSRIHPA